MFNHFNELSMQVVNAAVQFAKDHGHDLVGTEHILYGLTKHPSPWIKPIFELKGLKPEAVEKGVLDLVPHHGHKSFIEGYTQPAETLFKLAYNEAQKFRMTNVDPAHLLLATLRLPDSIAFSLLKGFGLSFENALEGILKAMAPKVNVVRVQGNAQQQQQQQAQAKAQTNVLDAFTTNLNALSKDQRLDPVVMREPEIERVIEILCRRTKNNPCLIGQPGVGKTAVVEGFAQRVEAGDVPKRLQGKVILQLNMASVVAGSKYRGEFEGRMTALLAELKKRDDVILFIDEVHTVVGAGGAEGAIDASEMLKPALARGDIQVIGATTTDHYRKYIEKDAAFERRFQQVKVEEPDVTAAKYMVLAQRDHLQAHHGIDITDEAIDAAVHMSMTYIQDRSLPDKALDILDEAGARASLKKEVVPEEVALAKEKLMKVHQEKLEAVNAQAFEQAAKLKSQEEALTRSLEQIIESVKSQKPQAIALTKTDVAEVIARQTGIPVARLAEDESARLLQLEDMLGQYVKGQDLAIAQVAKAIRRGRMGVKPPGRPTATFMFLGPTGVGKTELSKRIAELVFGSDQHLIRVDMSEYMEKHSVSKLLGAPPGYVGYEEAGGLTDRIRTQPYAVVLFDEIEKAHPDVTHVLLQLLDEGRLTDAKGRRVDFTNAMVIMTSNIGVKSLSERKRVGFSHHLSADEAYKDMSADMLTALKSNFRPEFVNRIDEVIVFKSMTEAVLKEILHIQIKDLANRLPEPGSSLSLSQSAEAYVLQKGYSEEYGARPLKRLVDVDVADAVAIYLLTHPTHEVVHLQCYLQEDTLKVRRQSNKL